jgi:hypothetical protein
MLAIARQSKKQLAEQSCEKFQEMHGFGFVHVGEDIFLVAFIQTLNA